MRNIRGKKRVRYEDVDSDYLFDNLLQLSLSFNIRLARCFAILPQSLDKEK
jgi:hypothetical protein